MRKVISKGCLAVIFLAGAVVLAPCAAGARQDRPPMDKESFIEHFDQDGDGMISVDEFPGDADRFSRIDKDSSGYIEKSEAPQGPPPGRRGPGMSMDDLDSDGDGQLSESEFPGPPELFDRLDADGDELLSEAELASGRRPGPPPGQE